MMRSRPTLYVIAVSRHGKRHSAILCAFKILLFNQPEKQRHETYLHQVA